jgi:hypothetical protein
MNTRPSDVLVLLRGPIDAAARARIVAAVASLAGVRGVRGAARAARAAFLLIVYFDPAVASARAVLRAVQSLGFTASLAGL